ncbi:MAG TPA: hypothetical protein VGU63_13000, partial [Candidatus Acidoferrales bacterium]|nr:hypothetical protein [Candidatus Acidoferrales bacterium]
GLNRMANSAPLAKDAQKLQAPADRLLAIFEQDMAKYPADEQARKWDALEQYVSHASSETPSKQRGLLATLQNFLRSLVGATHR